MTNKSSLALLSVVTNSFDAYAAAASPEAVVADRDSWILRAKCRGCDPESLFVQGAAQREAATFCLDCPVLQICQAEALDNRIEYGVWGGLTERQRRALLRKNPQVCSWAEYLAEGNPLPL